MAGATAPFFRRGMKAQKIILWVIVVIALTLMMILRNRMASH
jgi:hypothetical protein